MLLPATLSGILSGILSSIIRHSVEGDSIALLVDHVVLAVCISCIPSIWVGVLVSVAAFLGLAFYQTRVEFARPEDNDREEHGLCPVLSRIPRTSSGCSPPPSHPSAPSTKLRHFQRDDDEPRELHGTPMLFPTDLRHRRIAPFKDGFRHSYLYCGMPVGLHACYSPILCVDQPADPTSNWPFRRAWFSLRAEDHAIRGGPHMTMTQKLREFLLSEGADPNEWPYAYLLAVPCVNGQVDNPLGFWYLYNADKKLTAIIPELNTSYGERRMWLVRQELSPTSTSSKENKKSPYSFRGRFTKDIHVSPFMPPSGWYTVDTSDPCAPLKPGQLDILVTLTSPEGKPLMVTRVTSSQPGLDVPRASMLEKISFLARWWYVATCTVMTYRILSEAARIYFMKSARYWTRREPEKTALGKSARTVERTLERHFRSFLQHSVENHPTPISVTYITTGEHCKKSEVFHSRASSSQLDKHSITPVGTVETPPTPPRSPTSPPSDSPHIVFQVISPIFYSRFVHYKSPHAAFTGELLDDERTRTTWSSHPEQFTSIFSPTPSLDDNKEPSSSTRQHTPVKYPPGSSAWHWTLLSLLRRAPIATNYQRKEPYAKFRGLSDMDRFVLSRCSATETRRYRRAVLRVFVGEWIGGVPFGPLRRFTDDFEPFGLSRDGALRVLEAFLKTALLARAVAAFRGTAGETTYQDGADYLWLAAGNLWAMIKAYI